MTAGILGLGLIGGSFARAYSAGGHTVLAYDTDASVLSFARLCGAVSGELTAQNAHCCDLILLCVYPARPWTGCGKTAKPWGGSR